MLLEGVEEFGGVVALAADMQKPVGNVSERVRRVNDSKGQIQRASLDMLGHVTAEETGKTRLRILAALSREWGYEPPVRKRVVTDEDDARVSRLILESLPEPQRTAFRQERARLLGVKPEDL